MKVPPAFFALTLLVFGKVVLATPANDNFAAAVDLGPVPATATGDNTGATLESGEPDPWGGGFGTVWFRFQVPVDGWYTVHTASSVPANGLDTVVKLFSGGPDLGSAAMLGFNDESARDADYDELVYPDGYGPSRLVFRATAGTDYYVGVFGYQGNQGTFEIHAEATATPETRVEALSFSPATINVSAGSAGGSGLVSVVSTQALLSGVLTIGRPDNLDFYLDYDFGDLQRTSGDEFTGVYTVPITIGQYQTPGTWPAEIYLHTGGPDDYASWSASGDDDFEDDFLIPSSTRLQVANTGTIDAEAPVPTSLTASPVSIDVSAPEASLDLSVQFTDALAGFSGGSLYLSLDGALLWFGNFDLANLSAGDAQAGTITIQLPAYNEITPGVYDLVVELSDAVGNAKWYGGDYLDPLPPGSTTTLTITATPPANDNFASRIVLGPALPVSTPGDNFFATLEAGESDLNGMVEKSVWYEWVAPDSGWVTVLAEGNNGFQPYTTVFTGTEVATLQELGRNNGAVSSWEGNVPLVFFAQSGVSYKIAVHGPVSYYTSVGEFTLELAATAEPPARVNNIVVSPGSVDVGAIPRNITVEVTIESSEGLFPDGWARVVLSPLSYPGDGPHVEAYLSELDRISGDNFAGTYLKTITIPAFHAAAIWYPRVEVGTGSGSYHQWTPRGADPIIDTYLMPVAASPLVVDNTGDVDTGHPVLTGVSGFPATADVSAAAVPATLTLTVTDDLSGFEEGDIWLVYAPPGGGYSVSYLTSFTSDQRISGTPTSGEYEVPISLSNSLVPGIYYLDIRIRDRVGQTVYYGIYDTEFPVGANSEVAITNLSIGYEGWSLTQDFGPGGASGKFDDPNNDGVSNLLCYAFNIAPNGPPARPMTPGNSDESGLPAISVVGEGASRRLRIEFLQRASAHSGLYYDAQFSSSLQFGGPDGWISGCDCTSSYVNDDWLRVVVEDEITGQPTRFGRVGVESTVP